MESPIAVAFLILQAAMTVLALWVVMGPRIHVLAIVLLELAWALTGSMVAMQTHSGWDTLLLPFLFVALELLLLIAYLAAIRAAGLRLVRGDRETRAG